MTKPSSQRQSRLVLLINLGSPQELSVPAIRRFLRQFLSDPRVVGLPRLLWYPILYGIILPLRAKKLLHKYQQIWLANNRSPLDYYTNCQALQLAEHLGADYVVRYAHCYGQPSIASQLDYAKDEQISEIVLLPLYPQHSSSTSAAAFDQVAQYYRRQKAIPSLRWQTGFASHPDYIQALAAQVREHWQQFGRADCLLVSFHSLPVSLVKQGDPYVSECEQTYHALCHALGLNPSSEASLCYQSKFGKAEWVGPPTDKIISQLALAGVKSIDAICPGFVSDCLETLEEVAIQYRDLFIASGGEKFSFIPCFNASSSFTKLLASLV